MKREYISNCLLHLLSILICILIIYASSVVGQTNFSKDKIQSSGHNKVSDNPYLRLSNDKKNWQPITAPKFQNKNLKTSSTHPNAVIEYDIITKTISRSDYLENQTTTLSTLNSYNASQNIGIFEGKEQIETVFSPDNRIKISPTVDFPWRTICRLYITFPDGNHFVGSGVIIGRNDNISFHCLTAGHCVYRTEYGGWAETIEIIPALDNDYTPFYSAWATNIKTNEGWTIDSMPEYDWACIALDRQIGNFTGWMDRFTTTDLNWYQRIFHCAGYPIDYDFGLCLYYDSDSGRTADEYFHWYYMDASDGQDGMPIWVMDGNKRRIVSIHVGDDDGSGSNRGVRLNAEKFNQLNQWIHDDSPPNDRPDLIDDGSKWSNFQQDTVVRGFSQFFVWNDVRNIGTAYSGSVNVSYYASLDPVIDSSNDLLIGTIEITSIPPFTWRDSEWIGVFPEPIPKGEYYIGWIIDPDDRVAEFDESNNTAFVTVKRLFVRDPYIEIKTPRGGEVFVIGEKNMIQWLTAGGSGLVTIDVSYDAGVSWQNLVTNLPDSGYYQWSIPQTQQPALSCLVRINDIFNNLTDSSDATFIIETRPTIPGIPQDEGLFTNKADVLFSWEGSTDPETGISGYHIQVGTCPGSNDIADTLVEKELSYLATGSHNQIIYARVRARNGVGLVSHWSASSDGILIDITPPITTSTPIDQGEFSGIDSVLFQWDPAVDEESGIIDYQLQVGTAIDSVDIFDRWIGKALNYTVVGKQAQTLYARIRAKSGAQSLSDWSDWSDGITIDMTPPTEPGKPYSEALVVNFANVPFYWDQASEDISDIMDYHLRVIDVNASNEVIFDDWVGNVTEYIISGEDGQRFVATVQAKNSAGLVGSYSPASEPVQIHQTHIQLTLIEHSPTYPTNDWSNAIDNDIIGWYGTVSAYTNYEPNPYAIFGLFSGGTFHIDRIRLLTDTGVKYRKRWLSHFRLLYSLTGTNDDDFSLLLEADKHGGDWEEYTFPDRLVKYLKLILDQPDQTAETYVQLGEFQAFGRQEIFPNEKTELVLISGSETYPSSHWSNAIDNDIEGWDGTVSAITVGIVPNAIFAFSDSSVKHITKIRLLCDTDVGFDYRWVKEFKIEVSTTGIQDDDFHLVFDGQKNVGGWESFYISPVEAKYIKINKVRPNRSRHKYVQIGEIEIFAVKSMLPSNFKVSSKFDHEQELSIGIEPPQSYHVEQNYPNPFNPETTIRFQIPDDAIVTVKIYNLMGQEITTLIDGLQPAGNHSVMWNGCDTQGIKVPSGVYLYQFRSGKFNVTKKMILLE
ncbi:MAG: T9SS type A sorting domain-containing protein [bacterium]|nr:MAG: T9SS type A sorting domain-containing protein [bacterium]